MNVQAIGSEFPWYGTWRGGRIPLPHHHALFGLGRDAVAAILGESVSTRSRLWIPSFFCPQVVAAWRNSGILTERYPDNPRRTEPDWRLLFPGRHDAVLALNYFGIRCQEPWRAWHERHPDVTLIEDHTHDPASTWAMQSSADFAFASLRKTLPVPDGAVLWSPRAHRLPATPHSSDWTGSGMKLAGMLWKREFLDSAVRERTLTNGPADETLRRTYRRFETEGEIELEQRSGQAISPWSKELIDKGVPTELRAKREDNTRAFILEVQRRGGLPEAELLFNDWPTGHCPLNPVLVFDSPTARDACRSKLIAAEIFPPVHWSLPISENTDNDAWQLSRRLLTIPLDFRCNEEGLERVLTCLFDFKCPLDSRQGQRTDAPHLPNSSSQSTCSSG